jgi:hypothetical protein
MSEPTFRLGEVTTTFSSGSQASVAPDLAVVASAPASRDLMRLEITCADRSARVARSPETADATANETS